MRMRRLISGLLAVVAMAACGGDGPNDPDTVAGKYVLKTVNDKPLPYVAFNEGGYKLELTYSDYVLTTSGTYTSHVTLRETDNGVVTTESDSFTGTFTENGSSLSFVSPGGDRFQGTREGNRLTITFADEFGTDVAVYER